MATQIQPSKDHSEEAISQFHARFRPFVNPIYRGALILTADPEAAKNLQVKIYLEAYLHYLQVQAVDNFKDWLRGIVADSFCRYCYRCGMSCKKRGQAIERAMSAGSNYGENLAEKNLAKYCKSFEAKFSC